MHIYKKESIADYTQMNLRPFNIKYKTSPILHITRKSIKDLVYIKFIQKAFPVYP